MIGDDNIEHPWLDDKYTPVDIDWTSSELFYIRSTPNLYRSRVFAIWDIAEAKLYVMTFMSKATQQLWWRHACRISGQLVEIMKLNFTASRHYGPVIMRCIFTTNRNRHLQLCRNMRLFWGKECLIYVDKALVYAVSRNIGPCLNGSQWYVLFKH